jgi:hypothetical protein
MEDFQAYLGRAGDARSSIRVQADTIASQVRSVREFSLAEGSIGQVLFKRPGMFFGGYVIIKTALNAFRIDMTVLSTNSPLILETAAVIADSLKVSVGERFLELKS